MKILNQREANVQRVRQWRVRAKARIIAAFGGRCALCRYERCASALEIHHLDPMEKDFSFGQIRARPRSWSKMVEELRKCVLLCANCHREVHAGMAEVPSNAPRFDEYYAQYEPILREPSQRCQCGRRKAKRRNYCSAECPKRFGVDRIEWSKFDILDMKLTMSNLAISKVIGCSDVMVAKRIKKIEKEILQ